MSINTSLSTIPDEMISLATQVTQASFKGQPVEIKTESGRSYLVDYVWEDQSGSWLSTRGGFIRGFFDCPMCDKTLPGGNWIQVTLNSSDSPPPVVRLFELVHYATNHGEKIEDYIELSEQGTKEKCLQVFSNPI